MNSYKHILIVSVVLCFAHAILMAGTTGKIAGQVVDAETGQPLTGVNVLILGTNMGAATDEEGDYFIINVPPGLYTITASMIGYARVREVDVEVKIDRTAIINFSLATSVIEGEEVTVIAEREIVRRDVSHSEASISAETVTSTPSVNTVADAVLLQAGLDFAGSFVPSEKGDGTGLEGISIRGGRVDETQWQVDGMSITDTRRFNMQSNKISLTSIQEIQVLSGGFNAEYGDIRSGVINVVTKSGIGGVGKSRFSADAIIEYTPFHQRHWGENYYDYNNERSILYPYLGGQNRGLDSVYYQFTPDEDPTLLWAGWETYAANLNEDHPYYNDPESARKQFEWEHRKMEYSDDPDVNVDVTLAGPLPLLKNAGFMLSYVRDQIDYPYPTSRDVHLDQSTNLKLLFYPTSTTKIMVNYQYGQMSTVSSAFNDVRPGSYWLIENPMKVYSLNNNSFNQGGNTNVDHIRRRYSLKLTQTFSPKTYMEIELNRMHNNYYADHMRDRNLDPIYFIYTANGDTVGLDEHPFGWFGEYKVKDQIGYYVAGHGTRRDNSYLKTLYAKATLVSQINKYHQIKTGIDFKLDDIHNRFNQHRVEKSQIKSWYYDEKPIMFSGYIQDKIEYKGMIANVGLRFDYSKPTDEWFDHRDSLSTWSHWLDRGTIFYTANDISTQVDSFQYAPATAVDPKLALSPRIGVSHPISENSKLFFNYGHFYQRAVFERMFMEYWYAKSAKTAELRGYGNPNVDFEKTVAYELGFEQSIANMFLVRLAGYYKDITNELITIRYQGKTGSIRYETYDNNGYRDIRGLELSIEKRTGKYFTGFLNYDYRIGSSGRIGPNRIYQDPSLAPRIYDPEQSQPVVSPRMRASLSFNAPKKNFGPGIAGFYPLCGWNVNLLYKYEAGRHFTYNPEQRPGVENNMQWADWYNFDLRLGRLFDFDHAWARFFVEVTNLLNSKYIQFKPSNENITDARWDNYLGTLKEGDRVGEYDKDYLAVPRMEQLLFTSQPRTITFGVRFGF